MANTEELTRRVEELEAWKKSREAQQITFPLDERSRAVLQKYFLSLVRPLNFVNATGDEFRDVLVVQDDKYNLLSATAQLARYSADASTDQLTVGQDLVNLSKASFQNGNQVTLYTTGTTPGGLSAGQIYFVVNATSGGTVFKLSLSSGGAAINITSAGTGENYIRYV